VFVGGFGCSLGFAGGLAGGFADLLFPRDLDWPPSHFRSIAVFFVGFLLTSFLSKIVISE
jgi:hypothetical protein